MSVRLVLATRNAHKVAELRRILADADLSVEVLTVADFLDVPDVVESGITFAANALLKARAVRDATGLPCVADDSGFCLDVLNGMPGVFSARWAGRHGQDRANLELVLAQLADVPDERRTASFVCAAALATPDDTVQHVVVGRVDGHIVREPRGTGGFGYDPIFVSVDRPGRTTAELSPGEKDGISHRGRALRALAPYLRDLVVPD